MSSLVHSPQSVVRSKQGVVRAGQWRVLIDHIRSAAAHMACDEQLAQEGVATVRFFTWNPPAISLGWKQVPPAWLQWPRASSLEPRAHDAFEVVERPTGGGIALHGSDVSISVVIPREWNWPVPTMMERVCGNAVQLCNSYGVQADALLDAPSSGRIAYCLTETSPYAVMVGGRKLAGFALRRYPQSWLVQGSLLVSPLPRRLADNLPADVPEQLQQRATTLSEVTKISLTEAQVIEQWAEVWSAPPFESVAAEEGGR